MISAASKSRSAAWNSPAALITRARRSAPSPLADKEDVERQIERPRDVVRDGHAAAPEAEHDRVAAGAALKVAGQLAPGLAAVAEPAHRRAPTARLPANQSRASSAPRYSAPGSSNR
jgi:hypothetical protein